MPPNLFGIDIASIVTGAITSAGGLVSSTLVRSTVSGRNPMNPSETLAPTVTRHQCQAIFEARSLRRDDSVIGETVSVLGIVAGTISPPITPAVNDVVEYEGQRYTLTELVSSDPAEAYYEFRVN